MIDAGELFKLLEQRKQRKEAMLKLRALREFVAENYELLRKIRKGMTQAEFAAIANIPQSFVSTMERGSTERMGYEALVRALEVYSILQEAENERNA